MRKGFGSVEVRKPTKKKLDKVVANVLNMVIS